jgi:tRNA(Ile)-lysidine synthase
VNNFIQSVQTTVAKRRLLVRGQKILVAVSGGVDSLVLLHVLHALARANRWKIAVAHFNHHLRGRASAADEKLVRDTAKKLGLKFFGGGADVKSFAASARLSVEMAARKLRHEFLAGVARQQKIPTLALAHHADDQVELFFLRLLRGTGGEGLAGMKWRASSPAEKNVLLARPLLDFSKAELLAFAGENKIRFRADATNFSADILRNRIRNELLPLLRKKYQPAVDKTVLRLMDIAGAEAEVVSERARHWLVGGDEPLVRPRTPQRGVPTFEKLPLALQRQIIRQQLIGLRIPPEFERVEQLRETPDKPVAITAGIFVQRDVAGKVIRSQKTETRFNAEELKFDLSGKSGKNVFAGRKFSWSVKPSNGTRRTNSLFKIRNLKLLTEFFDADKIGGHATLRHWRAGDRFQPIGLKTAVKLQDLFVNTKIPAARRRALVLAEAAHGEIFWVESLRIGEPFKLTTATKRVLVWDFRWGHESNCQITEQAISRMPLVE